MKRKRKSEIQLKECGRKGWKMEEVEEGINWGRSKHGFFKSAKETTNMRTLISKTVCPNNTSRDPFRCLL